MKVEEQIDFLTKEINFNLKYMINLKQRIKYCKKEMKKKAILVNKKLNEIKLLKKEIKKLK